ncbi:MAG: polysaccharide deacetylase family protein [Myxococcales bacterium]|nr:polysaccharide deacetylase family protein [Myxococcales bacterium]
MKALAGRAASVLAASGLLGVLEAGDRRGDRLRVLAYHRVDEPEAEPDLDPGLLSATPRDFEAQMELLARRYRPISLADLIDALDTGRPLPPRAVLVTFDDGYRDFAERAWPILARVGVPAVLFVSTAFPDADTAGGAAAGGFWWDRLHATLARTREKAVDVGGVGRLPLGDARERREAHRRIRARVKAMEHDAAMGWLDGLLAPLADLPPVHRVLGWDALRKLAGEGVAVCAHGHRHALMTRLDDAALAEDLATSKRRIEQGLGEAAPPPVLAYPASACDERVRRAVRSAGYRLAFGGLRGIDSLPPAEDYEVMRLPVQRYATALFRAQLRPSVAWAGRMVLGR